MGRFVFRRNQRHWHSAHKNLPETQSRGNSNQNFNQVIFFKSPNSSNFLKYPFFSAFMDCLIIPLQEKLEDWKKSLVYLDKEHAKGTNLRDSFS